MLRIEKFLSDDQLDELMELLGNARYVDGSITAGYVARQVKNNLQCDPKDPNYIKANELIRQAIIHCEPMQSYALPNKVTPITFAKYGEGMEYGLHFDSAIMPLPNALMRIDVSFTVFLCDADEYEGGELFMKVAGIEQLIKGDRGDIVVYASGVEHRVNPITSGTRQVAVGWIQSLVENPRQREILFDILTVRNRIMQTEGKTPQYELLQKSYVNLQRMWSRP